MDPFAMFTNQDFKGLDDAPAFSFFNTLPVQSFDTSFRNLSGSDGAYLQEAGSLTGYTDSFSENLPFDPINNMALPPSAFYDNWLPSLPTSWSSSMPQSTFTFDAKLAPIPHSPSPSSDSSALPPLSDSSTVTSPSSSIRTPLSSVSPSTSGGGSPAHRRPRKQPVDAKDKPLAAKNQKHLFAVNHFSGPVPKSRVSNDSIYTLELDTKASPPDAALVLAVRSNSEYTAENKCHDVENATLYYFKTSAKGAPSTYWELSFTCIGPIIAPVTDSLLPCNFGYTFIHFQPNTIVDSHSPIATPHFWRKMRCDHKHTSCPHTPRGYWSASFYPNPNTIRPVRILIHFADCAHRDPDDPLSVLARAQLHPFPSVHRTSKHRQPRSSVSPPSTPSQSPSLSPSLLKKKLAGRKTAKQTIGLGITV